MKFYQHIYGRVAKGYQGDSEGFQLAALTDSIADRRELTEKLNRFSFFNLRGGKGGEARYSFYHPADGILAFGCSRLAQDLTGSYGSFAHNFVCEEKEFIKSGATPAGLLKRLPFLKSESELPDDRSLPMLEFNEYGTDLVSGEWREFALQITDFCLSKSGPIIPLVIASDEEAWAILSQLFSMLPRLESARLSFSTLFTNATDFIEGFRLAFVPEMRHVPSGTYVYRVMQPGQPFSPPAQPNGFISFLRQSPEHTASLMNLIQVLRHQPDRVEEAEAVLPALLSRGKLFRDSIEALEVPGILDLILKDEKWFTAYWQAGAALSYEAISPTIWENPQLYLIPVLTAVSKLNETSLAESILGKLARLISNGKLGLELISKLTQTQLQTFYKVAGQRLDYSDLRGLATKLKETRFYQLELHNAIAQRLLHNLLDRAPIKWIDSARWLRSETGLDCQDQLIRALAGLAEWEEKRDSFDYKLDRYRINQSEYRSLLEGAWDTGAAFLSAQDLIRAVFRRDYHAEFFASLSRKFRLYGYEQQQTILSAVADTCGARGAHDQNFLAALRSSEHQGELAEYFRKTLDARKVLDEHGRQSLLNIERNSRRGLFNFFRR